MVFAQNQTQINAYCANFKHIALRVVAITLIILTPSVLDICAYGGGVHERANGGQKGKDCFFLIQHMNNR